MSFVPAFSPTTILGLPLRLTITDESSGADASITQRRVYLRKADGTYLVPDGTTTQYIEWAIANSFINLDVLTKDFALAIRVDWLDVSNNVLYTSSNTFVFTQYSELFYYGLTQQLAGNYPIIADNNYYSNKLLLRVEIDSANQAVSIGGDILASQSCLDRAAYLISKQSDNF
jgi:hypothetical protein